MVPVLPDLRDRFALLRNVRWRYVLFEFVLIFTAVLMYFLVRGLTEGSPEAAYENADRIADFQQRLGFFWEPALQGWMIDYHVLVTFVNWIYIWAHWPVIGLVALWLVLKRPRDYRVVRNAFLISGGIGLIIFATFPVAPPRFAEPDVVDTITEYSSSYRVLQPPALVNEYAAMPSLHFGWNLIIGITLVWKARWLPGKALGFVAPPLMFIAIVLTANHYILDGIVGGIVALTGLAAALWLRNWRDQRRIQSEGVPP